MTLQTYARFLPDSETADGKGWALTYWEDDVVPPVTATEYFHALTNPDVLTYTVTNKALTSNVATLTTQGPHGFTVGQRVTVAITDTVFDGDYLITAVTSTTFSYARTNANVTSAAATGTAAIPKSLVERVRELMSADTSIQAHFLTKAQADFLAAGGNPATVTTNRNALLVGEGLVPPA